MIASSILSPVVKICNSIKSLGYFSSPSPSTPPKTGRENHSNGEANSTHSRRKRVREVDKTRVALANRMETVPCIFCATGCPQTFKVVEGKVTRFEGENDDGVLAKGVLSLFVLKRVLNISQESYSSLLTHLDGQYDPDLWVALCSPCRERAKEALELERKADSIKKELKELILVGSDNRITTEGAMPLPLVVWKQIRLEAVKGPKSPQEEDVSDDEVTATPTTTRKRAFKNQTERRKGLKRRKLVLESDDENLSDLDQDVTANPSPSRKKGERKRKTPYYKCELCGALVTGNITRIQQHKKLHDEDGGYRRGSECGKCGWVVGRMKPHLKRWHSKKKPNLSSANVIIRPLSSWAMYRDPSAMKETDSSNPNYVVYRQFNVAYFKCRKCVSLTFKRREQIEKHCKLHNEGTGTICLTCGWLIEPGRMAHHIGRKHKSYANPISKKKKKIVITKPTTDNVNSDRMLRRSMVQAQQQPKPSTSQQAIESMSRSMVQLVQQQPKPSTSQQAIINSMSRALVEQQPKPSTSTSQQAMQKNMSRAMVKQQRKPLSQQNKQPSRSKSDIGPFFISSPTSRIHIKEDESDGDDQPPESSASSAISLYHKCGDCGISFQEERKLHLHQRKVHRKKPFKRSSM